MSVPFEIRFDEPLNAIVVNLCGLWDMAIMEQFQAAMIANITALKARPRTWDVFVDAKDFAVQSPKVANTVETLFIRGRAVNTGYTTVVTSSMLSKMQAERAMGHQRLRAFLDQGEAVAWLKSSRAELDNKRPTASHKT